MWPGWIGDYRKVPHLHDVDLIARCRKAREGVRVTEAPCPGTSFSYAHHTNWRIKWQCSDYQRQV